MLYEAIIRCTRSDYRFYSISARYCDCGYIGTIGLGIADYFQAAKAQVCMKNRSTS